MSGGTPCPICGKPMPPSGDACPACTALAVTAAAAVEPPRLAAGRYRLERLLGRGGAKDVWLAHDTVLDRPVALSRLRAGAADEGARARVAREARVTARLGESLRIVTVHDAIEDDGMLMIVTRYMAGGSLAERLAEAPDRRLPAGEVLRVAEELAEALAHAHAHGVLHRDVKPANVWLAADGGAALGDFGIALAASEPADEPVGVGTPFYVAPETVRGEPSTPSSDLYGLGATLYELLAGRPPFIGDSVPIVLERHLNVAPQPLSAQVPEIPAELDALVLRLLAKTPDERPGSAAAVRDAVVAARRASPWTSEGPGTALIGRGRELAAAERALDAARTGGLQVLALAGEPGIGKTRLATAVRTAARAQGALAAWGRGVEDGGAYGTWIEPLRVLLPYAYGLRDEVLTDARRLAGELAGPAGSGDEARERVFDAATAVIARAGAASGLVLVLDDLHFADRSSLALLRHVVRRAPPDARVLLVLTYRDADLHADHPLATALEELARHRSFTRLGLEGFALDEVRSFVPADVALRDTVVRDLHARTGGNPFFVAELAHALADASGEVARAVPDSVREVVLRRLRPLGQDTRRTLDAAAVLDRPFTVPTVARIAALPPGQARAALEPARVARLVTDVPEAPGRLDFAHAIVRDAVRGALAPSSRGPLNAAVAAVLRDGDARAAEVARHALVAAREGEDPQEAYDASLEAGREAEALMAYAEAADHYGDALEALDELGANAGSDARQSLLERLAAVTMDAGDVENGRRHYRRAAMTARRARDTEAFARAALGFAEFVRYGETDHAGVELLQGALDVLSPDDSVLRVRATALLGARLDPSLAPGRRLALVDEAVAMARRLGDDAALTSALWVAVVVNMRGGDAARAHAAAEEILTLAPRTQNANALLWAHMSRLVAALERGDAAGVEVELAGCAALAGSFRRGYFRWCLLLLRSTWAAFRGRLGDGEQLAEEAVALVRQTAEDADQEYVVQRFTLAKLARRPDDVDRPALAAYARRYEELPVWAAMHADLAHDLGRLDEARASLAAAARHELAVLARTRDARFGFAVLSEPAAALGDPGLITRLYELLLPDARRNPVMDHGWAAWGPVERSLGLLAGALGRADEAAARLREAAALARAAGAAGWELRALADLAEPGDAERSRAFELAAGLGLAPEAAQRGFGNSTP
jgi:eukaryotic-like serine/threonine-protein kinase